VALLLPPCFSTETGGDGRCGATHARGEASARRNEEEQAQ
jgi:hypothetical protein